MIVVSDTSPIRGLISIEKIQILKKLFNKVLIPEAVKEELLKITVFEKNIETLLNQDWIEIISIQNIQVLKKLRNHLDLGESEAIVLAKEVQCDLILMDENKGRKIAKSLNLEVIGLIGILIMAKENGFIKELKPSIDLLRNKFGFWIKDEFYEKIMIRINEQ